MVQVEAEVVDQSQSQSYTTLPRLHMVGDDYENTQYQEIGMCKSYPHQQILVFSSVAVRYLPMMSTIIVL